MMGVRSEILDVIGSPLGNKETRRTICGSGSAFRFSLAEKVSFIEIYEVIADIEHAQVRESVEIRVRKMKTNRN